MEEDEGAAHFSDEDSFFAGSAEEKPQEDVAPEPKHKEPKPKKSRKIKKMQKGSWQPKKQHTSKEKEKEHRLLMAASERVDNLLQRMRNAYDKDRDLFERKKLACQKINFLPILSTQLKNVYTCEKFLEKDGLAEFERWLEGITIGEKTFEPSVSLRKGVMQVLYDLNLNNESVIRTNDIQRLVARQKRSQVKQLRDLSEKIILKWNKIAYEAE